MGFAVGHHLGDPRRWPEDKRKRGAGGALELRCEFVERGLHGGGGEHFDLVRHGGSSRWWAWRWADGGGPLQFTLPAASVYRMDWDANGPVNPSVTMHLPAQSGRAIKLPPLAGRPVASGTR